MGDTVLSVQSISKSYGAAAPALRDVSVEVFRGELFCLLGPSGCGKTTLLNIVAGIIKADTGRVWLNGDDITDLPVYKRNIGVVFQSYALFPHLTVGENIAFGLKMKREEKSVIRSRVGELLDLIGLSRKINVRPHSLSGGEQQRVALARALATRPELLLLDEPFSSLDAKLRVELRAGLRRIQEELRTTTVMVTHDQEEALSIADRIGVANDGRLEQVGTPEQVYSTPKTSFVASFMGESNTFSGIAEHMGGADGLRCGAYLLPMAAGVEPGTQAVICVRPESVQIIRSGRRPEGALPGRVTATSYRGYGWLVDLETELGHVVALWFRDRLPTDVECYVSWDPEAAVLLRTPESEMASNGNLIANVHRGTQ